jgi:hypothetical protein
MMTDPECPVEYALWWVQRFCRTTACVWAPRIDQLELFESICQLRVQSWTSHLGNSKPTKWKILQVLSTADPRKRPDVIRDVLVHEPMLRILAATAKSIRAHEIRQRVQPIFHEAFVSIRQVRCMALEQLIEDLDRGSPWARALNRLRISIEEWSDMLLGISATQLNVPIACFHEYGFSTQRLTEFAYDASESNEQLSGMLQDWLLLQGIRRTMRSFGPHLALQPTWEAQLRQLATGFLMPKSFISASITSSMQIDQRLDALEHWFSLLEQHG